MNAQDAVLFTARILSIGAAIDAAEILLTPREYAASGIYSWELMRTNNRWSTMGVTSRVLDGLFSQAGFMTLMALQVVVALSVLGGLATPLLPEAIFLLFLLRGAINVRHQYGLDGADQMNVIVLASLVLWCVAPSPLAKEVALWFIAFQSVLSYVTAGVAKAVSPIWRSGAAVRDIVNTRSYGSRIAVGLFDRLPALKPIACWWVILFECTFPLALLSPRLAFFYFAMGVAFHIGIAATMGLNNFVWPFLATYPAVYIAMTDLRPVLGRWVHWQ